jgi:hypothetical protein
VQDKAQQENDKNYKMIMKNVQKEMIELKQAMNMPHLISPIANDMEYKSIRGQIVMNQLGNSFGYLPMTRQ